MLLKVKDVTEVPEIMGEHFPVILAAAKRWAA